MDLTWRHVLLKNARGALADCGYLQLHQALHPSAASMESWRHGKASLQCAYVRLPCQGPALQEDCSCLWGGYGDPREGLLLQDLL